MTSFHAVLIGLFFMAIFAAFFVIAWRFGQNANGELITFKDKWFKWIFLGFACLGFLLCLYLILQNHFIYFWDYNGYWMASCNTMLSLFKDPSGTVRMVYQTILNSDYNYILPLLVAIPLRIFGYTFSRYVLLNFLLFLVPTWAVIVTIVWKMLLYDQPKLCAGKKQYLVFGFTLFMVAAFNPFYYAMLRGYIDVACLIPSSLAVLLFMDYDALTFNKRQVIRDILISACLLTAFLFRRFFAFFVVGYSVALFAFSLYEVIKNYGDAQWGKKVRNAVLNLLIVGVFAVMVLLIFFRPLVERILANNYANQYVGYNAPFLTKLSSTISRLGLITVILAVVALILSLILKKNRKLTVFCFLSSVVTIFSFYHVQNIEDHHLYIIAAEFCILMILGVYQIIGAIKRVKYKHLAAGVAAAVLAIGTLNCFFPSVRPVTGHIAKLYSQEYQPMQMNDIDALHDLAEYSNNLTDGTGKHVYVCASGVILNANILQSLDLPYSNDAIHNLNAPREVDLRDGFPSNFLQSDYIIVTKPVQLHLAKGTQEVVRFLCEEVQNQSSPVGRHFVKLDRSFKLDGGVTAYVYEKVSDFEKSDYQYLANYYSKKYPGKDAMFADRIWAVEKENQK